MHDPQHLCLFIGQKTPAPHGFTSIFEGAETTPGPWVRSALRAWPDRTVDRIVCSFFIEHLSQTEILILLRECRRMLRPGGTLEVLTPDLAVLGARYAAGQWPSAGTDTLGAHWITGRAEYLNTMLRGWDRCWLCDGEELARLADQAGLPDNERLTVEADTKLPLPADELLSMRFTKPSRQYDTQALVSIIVPAFRPDYLVECLESALAQTHRPLEIVIVDDSLDAEVERICREYAERDPCIRYTRNALRLGEARNLTQGIRLARGEFIKPLYDDDLLHPDCIETLLAAYVRTPDARLAIGRRNPIDESGRLLDDAMLGPPLADNSGTLPGGAVIAEIADSGINKVGEPTVMLFRRDDALALPEPDVMSLFRRRFYGIGDVGLALNLLSRGDLAYVAESIARFRLHPGQNQKRPNFRDWVSKTWVYFRDQAARLGLDMTAQTPLPRTAVERDPFEAHYQAWLTQRGFVAEDVQFVEAGMRELPSPPPAFHVTVRLRPGDESALADTLDSFNLQFYPHWCVDIVGPVDAPEGFDAHPQLGWHRVDEPEHEKTVLDLLVTSRACQLVVDLPPGTRLDPLCLWRVAVEHARQPGNAAFFTDDDRVDAGGRRHSPRFKDALDLDVVRSADLAGPLFVERETLREAGGLPQAGMGGAYDLLLRLLEHADASRIRHISDSLLSLPETDAADSAANMEALARHLTRLGEDCDVAPIGPTTWRVLYYLSELPRVSVLISSRGALEFLKQSVEAVTARSGYPALELLITIDLASADADVRTWLTEMPSRLSFPCRILDIGQADRTEAFNRAADVATGTFLLFLHEEALVMQDNWLPGLLGHALRKDVGAVMPRLLQPQTGLIDNVGYRLGQEGIAGAPYHGTAGIADEGYLDALHITRRVEAAPFACLLVGKSDFLACGGLDTTLPAHYDLDFSLRLRSRGRAIVCAPAVAAVTYHPTAPGLTGDPVARARDQLITATSEHDFMMRWASQLLAASTGNPNLSLASPTPRPESAFLPPWRYLPAQVPRMFARSLPNGQGTYRVSMPMRAAQQAGLLQGCEAFQDERSLSPLEIARVGADSLIVQHYLSDLRQEELQRYRQLAPKAFIVYAADDLITDMPLKSQFRKFMPADARSRLKAALRHCDRLVVSTEFLAEEYRNLIGDIRVVPNRLLRQIWSPLSSRKRTAPRPRIGWAGGTGHLGDLALLREVIEATRDEADWVLFGECPDDVRPLLAEHHSPVAFADYPARLAALNLDIAVAPLENHPFNQGKSNLRLLEYGALGLPVVCTDITPYRGTPACTVENHAEAWIAALRERIHDPDSAEREGEAMRKWVLSGFMLEDHASEWATAHLPD